MEFELEGVTVKCPRHITFFSQEIELFANDKGSYCAESNRFDLSDDFSCWVCLDFAKWDEAGNELQGVMPVPQRVEASVNGLLSEDKCFEELYSEVDIPDDAKGLDRYLCDLEKQVVKRLRDYFDREISSIETKCSGGVRK